MNERIKLLAEQCGFRSNPDIYDRNQSFDMEKFAELIIQKCISQVALIGISNFENDDVMWATKKAIENIREHFGVEEYSPYNTLNS